MKYSIMYPTPIESIKNVFDDNIDVCVCDERGQDYTFVFITPQNLTTLMNRGGRSYIEPRFKFLVVSQLKKQFIEEVISIIMTDSELSSYFGLD